VAEGKRVSCAQLALAWVRRGNWGVGRPWIVPVAGAGSVGRVRENCGDVGVSGEELGVIDEVLKRYPAMAAGLAEY